MKNLKFIVVLLSVFLTSCSAESEVETNFEIPSYYVGEYQKQNSNLYLILDKHRIRFNTPDGEMFDISEGGFQMATDDGYFTVGHEEKVMYFEAIGGGLYFDFLEDGVRNFDDYYEKIE
jgi:hypothetical protein